MTQITKPMLLLGLVMAMAMPRIAVAQEAMITLVNSITGTEILLTEAEFLALPQHVVNTENENVDAMTAFEGPLARDIIALLGREGASTVVLTATDDYSVEIPIEDYFTYDVIFARTADGQPFSRRTKGPIWVIYPMSEFAALQDPVYNSRQIWQLKRLEIR